MADWSNRNEPKGSSNKRQRPPSYHHRRLGHVEKKIEQARRETVLEQEVAALTAENEKLRQSLHEYQAASKVGNARVAELMQEVARLEAAKLEAARVEAGDTCLFHGLTRALRRL
ncbi:unnamed protein product [Effrenium voratum]|nr:unnamed protein product [Effrenium voratum]